MSIKIRPNQINLSNWRVGNVLEDVRQSSATYLQQVEIEDYQSGAIICRLLDRDERVKPEFLAGRIVL